MITTTPFKASGNPRTFKLIGGSADIKEGDLTVYQTASGLWRVYGKMNKEKIPMLTGDSDYFKAKEIFG